MKTEFLASENHFVLPFSDTAATDSFIFPSSGIAFLNALEMGNGNQFLHFSDAPGS